MQVPALAGRTSTGRTDPGAGEPALASAGVRITTGTIVDATILHAPTSTKNREQQRDPEMHQTKKGKQWYFGIKAHVGVDSKTKIIHTAVATAANVADSAVLPDLLHGEETRVWGDQACYVARSSGGGCICSRGSGEQSRDEHTPATVLSITERCA